MAYWSFIKRLYSGKATKKEIEKTGYASKMIKGKATKAEVKGVQNYEWKQYKTYKKKLGKNGRLK